MKYYLYIVRGIDNSLYTGITKNIKKRVWQHNFSKLGAKSLKGKRPVELVYQEKYITKSDAMKREWYFKNTGEGNKLMRKLISQKVSGGLKG